MSRAVAAPQPAGLKHHVAAEVYFLPQVAIYRDERRAPRVGRPGLGYIHAKLELPGLGAVVFVESPTRLGVPSPRRQRVERQRRHQAVAAVVDSLGQSHLANRKLVAHVGA